MLRESRVSARISHVHLRVSPTRTPLRHSARAQPVILSRASPRVAHAHAHAQQRQAAPQHFVAGVENVAEVRATYKALVVDTQIAAPRNRYLRQQEAVTELAPPPPRRCRATRLDVNDGEGNGRAD